MALEEPLPLPPALSLPSLKGLCREKLPEVPQPGVLSRVPGNLLGCRVLVELGGCFAGHLCSSGGFGPLGLLLLSDHRSLLLPRQPCAHRATVGEGRKPLTCRSETPSPCRTPSGPCSVSPRIPMLEP